MTPDQTAQLACSELREEGFRGAVVPAEYIVQLEYEIEQNVSEGRIDAGLHERYLAYFRFDVAANLPEARSIIITAAPQPQRRATFCLKGQTYPVIIPPTYYYDTDDQIQNILQRILSSKGYQLHLAALPSKLLAVCSGMAKYGKSNIAYVEGLGSFARLRAFLSDMPAAKTDGFRPEAMKECRRCKACLNACPTEAIVPDRFLIHAERCITFLNEGDAEFPEWVDPAWHNSLVGCMRCQLICPVNKPFIKWVEDGEDFDEDETALILSGVSPDHIPPETAQKLNRCYMMEYLDLLPRNLRVLLK
jgi:epoxyqueuosine reductase